MAKKRKGYNTKPKDYREKRLKKVAEKYRRRYLRYLKAFEEWKHKEEGE